MSKRKARFEIVHRLDPERLGIAYAWWARFRGANGQIVWVTETYRGKSSARNAIRRIDPAGAFDVRDVETTGSHP